MGKQMMAPPRRPSMARGVKMSAPTEATEPAMPAFKSRALRPGGMAKGGKVHADAAMDRKLIRQEIARAERKEDAGEMKKGGAVKYAKGGGVEMKGKTKGRVC